MVTQQQLQSLFNKTKSTVIESFVDPINKTLEKFEINTASRIAMFLAQIGHESGGLNFTKENLNYKAESLVKVFPKYFRNWIQIYMPAILKKLQIAYTVEEWEMDLKKLERVTSIEVEV